jgi:phosphoglycolate phosphatase
MAAPAIRGVLFDKDGTLFDFGASWRGAADRVLAALAPGDAAMQARLGDAVGYDVESGAFAPGSPIVAGATAEVAGTLAAMLPDMSAERLESLANAAAETATLAPAAPDLPGLLDTLLSGWPRARRRDA